MKISAKDTMDEALQAVQTWQEKTRRLEDERDRQTIETLSTLVDLHVSLGQYDDAELLCRQAIDDTETSGADRLHLAKVLTVLEGLYRRQARYVEATGVLLDALVFEETALGLDHPSV